MQVFGVGFFDEGGEIFGPDAGGFFSHDVAAGVEGGVNGGRGEFGLHGDDGQMGLVFFE